ncbi:hypothetical protein Ahy_A10g047358 isoform H [Arachis hypogaea]|uniref:Uncharacterized protein n=1 Tax=Arachis hypogaea TaxID=3818 RepID=A0A445B2E6_ARAHY|nr:hypothetical protein Ahy_A10g047358 isoform H [Arachis hypogaea]
MVESALFEHNGSCSVFYPEYTRDSTKATEHRSAFNKYNIRGLSQCLNWPKRFNDNSHAASYLVNHHFTSDRNTDAKDFSSKVQWILCYDTPYPPSIVMYLTSDIKY